jgi:hypothetical protein
MMIARSFPHENFLMNSEHCDARDAILYAPLGLADLCAEKVVPVLKEEVENLRQQIPAARFIGQMAAQQATKQASQQLTQRYQATEGYLNSMVALGNYVMTKFSGGIARNPQAGNQKATPLRTDAPVTEPATQYVATELEAIEGYDNLSASQIVGLLDGLSIDELEEVEVYESGHRRRRTILNRILQLRDR